MNGLSASSLSGSRRRRARVHRSSTWKGPSTILKYVVLGWQPTVSLDDRLRTTIGWFRTQLESVEAAPE
jgi:hypothetical protein